MCYMWVQITPWEGAILRGEGWPIVKYRDTLVICAKVAEPIKVPFQLLTWMGPKNHELECGPMPNVMVALPNIGGALCSTPQSLADAHY